MSRYDAYKYTNVNDCILMGFKKFPEIAAAYRLPVSFNPQAGTSESDFPLAELSRPILPSLLTRYLTNTVSDSNTYVGNLSARMPVVVEWYDDTALPPVWRLATEGDGLAIDADGTIWVTGLRVATTTYKTVGSYTTDPAWDNPCHPVPRTGFTLILRPLRFSCAIPLDHNVTASYNLSSDLTAGVVPFSNTDVNRIELGFSRTMYVETGGSHKKELRRNSFPHPESVPNAAQIAALNSVQPCIDPITPQVNEFTDKLGGNPGNDDAALRDDTILLQNLVKRKLSDFGCVPKGGRLIIQGIIPGLEVGTPFGSISNTAIGGEYQVNGMIQSIEYKFSRPQQSILEIA